MRRVLTLALATTAVLIATPASASLVYDANATLTAQGFGSAPRDLSIQGHGNATTESGCVGVTGAGVINVGTGGCMGTDAAIDPNGTINAGGNETPPPTDNQKFGIPTVSQLGWTSAADIGILFNVTDPGAGESVTLTDITLKFYDANGSLLGSIDGGPQFFSATDIGNGSAGFIFTVQGQNEIDYVNNILATGGSTIYTALEGTVDGVAGGPETFAIINLNRPTSVPEAATWAMMLLGFGGIGMAMRRSRKGSSLLQIA
jgi:hypothetical protein